MNNAVKPSRALTTPNDGEDPLRALQRVIYGQLTLLLPQERVPGHRLGPEGTRGGETHRSGAGTSDVSCAVVVLHPPAGHAMQHELSLCVKYLLLKNNINSFEFHAASIQMTLCTSHQNPL